MIAGMYFLAERQEIKGRQSSLFTQWLSFYRKTFKSGSTLHLASDNDDKLIRYVNIMAVYFERVIN